MFRFPVRSTVIALALFLFILSSAYSSIVLKPKGQPAAHLRMKSISADVSIEGQFADTRLLLTFQNEQSDRVEADFLYTLPSDTIATYFAYWYGEEKVIARIVEKERAAAIYKHITTRQRDPALIEMVGKNMFRARIFPIEPNADLKVEIHLVQALPSDSQGILYQLPIAEVVDRQSSLDSVDVKVSVKGSEDIEKVITNYGIPVTERDGGYRIELSGTNYRPQKNLNVRLVRKTSPIHAVLYSARSGGEDGFFALAVTPEGDLARPRISIEGVRTYEVVQPNPSSVKAHHPVFIFGRYKGSGDTRVLVRSSGKVTSAQVRFSPDAVPNNMAAELWASKRIELLSSRDRYRTRVMELSKRFNLPTKYTSWLAIPKEELEIYRREKAEADAELVAAKFAKHILNGTEKSVQAQILYARLKELSKQADRTPESFVQAQLWDEENTLLSELRTLVEQGRGGGRKANSLRRTLDRMGPHIHGAGSWKGDVKDSITYAFESRARDLSWNLAAEKYSDHPDKASMSDMRRKISLLMRYVGQSPEEYIADREDSWFDAERDKLMEPFVYDLDLSQPDKAELRAGIRTLNTRRRGPQYAADFDRFLQYSLQRDRLLVEARDAGIAYRSPEYKEYGEKGDELWEQMQKIDDRMAARWGERPIEKVPRLYFRWGDPLISVEAPADAQQVIAILPDGTVKVLKFNSDSRHWEGRFDIPIYASEGDYTITVIIVLKDGTRKVMQLKYRVDVTAPAGRGSGSVSDRTLRLELQADEDTARVSAVLPWGEKIELRPSSQEGRFFALVPLSGVSNDSVEVVFFLTDKAHNRASVTIEVPIR